MIGIIGYGMVGKAVKFGFNRAQACISDPQYNDVTVDDVCRTNPDAIFVCVPTPTDNSNYATLNHVLDQIEASNYQGLVVVKSTILPKFLGHRDIIYNPEFLSRASANEDFINPPMVIIGGNRASELLTLYRDKSQVNLDRVFITDVKTAAMAKYTMNSFYATKITFMNQMYDVAQRIGVDWNELTNILSAQPWMGTHHFQVPGPDGRRGFGGPCLPKDTEALVKEYNVELLRKVLELNTEIRQ